MEISTTSWILANLGIFILGISKSGLKGIGIVIVTLMALAFGAKVSTGLIVPLLVVGDIFAAAYYRRHVEWKYMWRFLPWIVVGLLIGTAIGKDLPEALFKWCMAAIILLSVGLMWWWDLRKSKKVPTHWTFGGVMGIVAGTTSMIGNLAGVFSNIFFLAMRLPKNAFIGTAAWVFLVVDIVKLPFHIFIWETISWDTLVINAKLLPALFIGLLSGVRIVRAIADTHYRKMILILTAFGALMLLLR
jgi:uncharacterized membrane protein YfcA